LGVPWGESVRRQKCEKRTTVLKFSGRPGPARVPIRGPCLGGPGDFRTPLAETCEIWGVPVGHHFLFRFGVVLGALGNPPSGSVRGHPETEALRKRVKNGVPGRVNFYNLHMEGSPFGGRSGPHGFPEGLGKRSWDPQKSVSESCLKKVRLKVMQVIRVTTWWVPFKEEKHEGRSAQLQQMAKRPDTPGVPKGTVADICMYINRELISNWAPRRRIRNEHIQYPNTIYNTI